MDKRIVIYLKDVCQVLGCSRQNASRLLNIIRNVHNKAKHQRVTIREFCDYEGLNIDEVRQVLNITV